MKFFISNTQINYALSLLFFENDVCYQFDLLIIGINVMSTFANCWTVALGGNIDLSISINMANSVLYFGKHKLIFNNFKYTRCLHDFSCFSTGMSSLWIFTLGKKIFPNVATSDEIRRDCLNILLPLCYTIIPFCVGLLFQSALPKSKKCAMQYFEYIAIIYIMTYILIGIMADGSEKLMSPIFLNVNHREFYGINK